MCVCVCTLKYDVLFFSYPLAFVSALWRCNVCQFACMCVCGNLYLHSFNVVVVVFNVLFVFLAFVVWYPLICRKSCWLLVGMKMLEKYIKSASKSLMYSNEKIMRIVRWEGHEFVHVCGLRKVTGVLNIAFVRNYWSINVRLSLMWLFGDYK